jgi:aminoacyl tRNA synthase complex-interacting multifunctional protein 1
LPSITRYFDHVQSESVVRTSAESLGDAFKVIPLDIENAPAPERKVEAPKKKEKAPKTPAPEASATPAQPATPSSEPAEQPQKKEKKEKKKDAAAAEGGKDAGKKAGGKGGAKAPAADDGEPVPSMIDLRVGHIVDSMSFHYSVYELSKLICAVMKHPDADGLYVEVSCHPVS